MGDFDDTIRGALKRIHEPVRLEPSYQLVSDREYRRITRDEARGYCAPWPPWSPPKRFLYAKAVLRRGAAARIAPAIEAFLRRPGALQRGWLVVCSYDAYCQRAAFIHGPDPAGAIDPEGTYLVLGFARARRGLDVRFAKSDVTPLQVHPTARPTEEEIQGCIPRIARDLARVFAGSPLSPGGWTFLDPGDARRCDV